MLRKTYNFDEAHAVETLTNNTEDNNHEQLLTCFQCDQCMYTSKYKFQLQRHINSKHMLKWFKYDRCAFKTNYEVNLNKNMKVEHSSIENKKLLQCAHCKYKTVFKNILQRYLNKKHFLLELEKNQSDSSDFKTTHLKANLKQHIPIQ